MANRIRELREESGLTLEQLGDMIGATHATIQRLETGKMILTEKYVRSIAAALRRRPGEIFEKETASSVDDTERRAIALARKLPERQRAAWFQVGDTLAQSARFDKIVRKSQRKTA